MAYVITEPCIGVCDTSCVEVCPVDCIYPRDGYENPEGQMLYIHPDECIDCGACEPECPVEAIYEETIVPNQWQQFIRLNAAYFEKKNV